MLETVLAVSDIVRWGFKIYFWIHVIAFLLSWVHADRSNSIVYYINRMTTPLWDWVSAKVPREVRPLSPYLALMLILFMEIFAPGLIRSLGASSLGQLSFGDGFLNSFFYFAIASLSILQNIIWFIFLMAVVWFVLTLVNPSLNNPIVQSVMLIVDPLITPLQKILPRAKIDLSPLVLALISFIISRSLDIAIFPLKNNLII